MSKLKTLAQWRAEKGLIKESQEDTEDTNSPEVHMKYARMMLGQNRGVADPTLVRKLQTMISVNQKLAAMSDHDKFAALMTAAAKAVYPEEIPGRNVSFSGTDRRIAGAERDAGMANPV